MFEQEASAPQEQKDTNLARKEDLTYAATIVQNSTGSYFSFTFGVKLITPDASGMLLGTATATMTGSTETTIQLTPAGTAAAERAMRPLSIDELIAKMSSVRRDPVDAHNPNDRFGRWNILKRAVTWNDNSVVPFEANSNELELELNGRVHDESARYLAECQKQPEEGLGSDELRLDDLQAFNEMERLIDNMDLHYNDLSKAVAKFKATTIGEGQYRIANMRPNIFVKDFQLTGAWGLSEIEQSSRVMILADAVGMGKTWTLMLWLLAVRI